MTATRSFGFVFGVFVVLGLVWGSAAVAEGPLFPGPEHSAGEEPWPALPQALTVVYVDASADQTPHDGSDWCHAYLELYEALAVAGVDTIVRVADGTYLPDTSGLSDPREATFQLANGVTIEGGYAGCGAADPDERDIELYETTLSGDIGTPSDPSDNCYHVVTGSGTDVTGVLDGFMITGGNADLGSPETRSGGGMYNDNGSPTVTNCTFSGNSADYGLGGGMCNRSGDPTVANCTFSGNSAKFGAGMFNDWGSSPTVVNCTFDGNSADSSGGGMYNSHSSPTLTNCAFTANSAFRGGGMDNDWSGNPTVVNCTFDGNSADYRGGAMVNRRSSPTLTDCSFSGNSAGAGGGIYNDVSSNLTVVNCTFSGNSASGAGGGMYNEESSPRLTHCTFSSNYSADRGGGMYSRDCAPRLTSCSFGANSADRGGGVFNSRSSPTLANCTLNGNSADDDGGGMFNWGASSPTLTNTTFSDNWAGDKGGGVHCDYTSCLLKNCIIWGNVPNAFSGHAPIVTFSDVEGGWEGQGNIDADPLLVDADGPDEIPGTEDDDLRLRPGSPCIDAGDNTAVPPDEADLDGNGDTTERTPLDLDGSPRFVDDPPTGDTGVPDPPYYTQIVDMGAYEFFPDCNDNGIQDGCDMDCGTSGGPCDMPGCGQSEDCNTNKVPDECDIAEGTSQDANDNGIPDECESPPVAICQDVTAEADGDCQADVAPEDVDDDSYDPDGGPIDLSLDPPGPYPLSPTTVTLTVTDDLGQTDTCTATVTVVDGPGTPPTITCPPDVTVECDESTDPWHTGEATATDNCDSDPMIDFLDSVAAGSCLHEWAITRTWTATDDAGNSSSCDQVITVEDTVPPTITCPADVIIICGESTDPGELGVATATDNCDSAPAVSYSDVEEWPTCLADPVMYTITRTWTATDDCGNSSECVHTVSVLRLVHSGLIIKQGACPAPLNRSSHGVLPVVLTGDFDFDVYDVDLATVRLSRADCVGGSVAPNHGPPGPKIKFRDLNHPYVGEGPCSCNEDQESDGIVDLSMKLRTDDLVEALELESLSAGALVELVVSGTLADGCEFTATDCVRLVPPGTLPGLLAVESSVAGAWIDVGPLDETLDGGGFTDFERTFPLTTVVTLTAEEWAEGRPLRGWQIGGLLHHMGQTSVEFAIDQDMRVRAVYGPTPSGGTKPPDEMTPDEVVPESIQGQSVEAGTIDRR